MSLEDDITLLSRVPLFADLSKDHLRLLAFSAPRRQLKAGEILFEADTEAESGYVVARGRITLRQPGARKERPVDCGEAALIGETALFTPTRRPGEAVAATDAEVIEISRGLVGRMLNEYPHIAVRLRGMMLSRLRATLGAISEAEAPLRDETPIWTKKR